MQSNLENKLSILVLGYDPYCDVWPYFDYFYKKNANALPGLRVFVSGSKPFESKANFISLTTNGDLNFSTRIKTGLKLVKTKYVLLLMEDCIPSKHANLDLIQSLVEEMDVEQYAFCEIQNYISKSVRKKALKNKLIREIKSPQHYRMSLQPAIWDTQFLNELTKNEIVRPWDFEVLLDKAYYNVPLGAYPRAGAAFIHAIDVTHFIDKGLYTKKAIHLIKKEHLPMPTRKVESYAMEFNKWCYNKIAAITPSFLRRSLKKTGKKMGGHFYTDN